VTLAAEELTIRWAAASTAKNAFLPEDEFKESRN